MPKQELASIKLEYVKAVADLGDFEETANYVPAERELRTQLKEYLEEAGIDPRHSRQFKIIDGPEFYEFDSSNISYACGYWTFTVGGPRDLVIKLNEGETV